MECCFGVFFSGSGFWRVERVQPLSLLGGLAHGISGAAAWVVRCGKKSVVCHTLVAGFIKGAFLI